MIVYRKNGFNLFYLSKFTIDKELKEKILSNTYNKLNVKKTKKEIRLHKKKNIPVFFSIRNIAAACLIIFVLSTFIPGTPANALYQKLFSFVPGIGVIENEYGIIKGALNESVRVENNNEFLEVKSAYIANNTLNIIINTNISTDHIENIKDKQDALKFFSGENMPGVYLKFNNQEQKLNNFTTGSLSIDTKAYTINGYFHLYENTPVKTLFHIAMDGFEKTADFKLSPVKKGDIPDAMGSNTTINDIIVFANTNRTGDILSVNLSTVAPKIYQGVRFHLFNHEKALFLNSVYILDNKGVKYYPDENLRKQNSSGIHSFYFRIPHDKKAVKIVLPQVLFSRDFDSEIKIEMPKVGKEVNINRKICLDNSLLKIEQTSIVPKNDSLLPEQFKDFDCMKIDYSTEYINESNEKILRIIPDIQVSDSLFEYRRPSSGSFSELLPLDKNASYALVQFEDMDKTKKVLLNLEIEYGIIGPFDLNLNK